MNLKEIIGQHEKSVGRAFKRVNVKSEVNEKNLLLTSILYQGEFLDALEDEINKEPEKAVGYNFGSVTFGMKKPANDGLDPKTRQTNLPEVVVKAKKERGQKVKNTISDILSVVGQGLGAFIGAKNASRQDTSAYFPPPPVQAANATNKMKTAVVIGILLIVLLLVILFVGKAKK